MNSIQ